MAVVNQNHAVCGGPEWAQFVREVIVPTVLPDVGALGDDVLEVGPGYGATTDVFREQVAHLTAVEIDPELAAALAERLAGANVTVVEGDATAMAFDDDRFTGATCFSMLHHVPSEALQDRLFAEVARVVRPGGLFAATDSVHAADLEAFHEGDTFMPLDPATIADRLARAGFVDVEVRSDDRAWSALARVGA